MVSLSNIQQLIINQLLLNNQQNHLSFASTVQSAHPTHREILSQILIDDEDTNNEELEILQDSKIEQIDQELHIYNQNSQNDEIEAKLSKCQTDKALLKIEKQQRLNNFLTQPSPSMSPKDNIQQKTTSSSMYSTTKTTIYKRSVSPIFTTVRHLFSVIRI
ncbi:unnamed protein product (macronuclear) [Paramecium tetraurelia]|uniref:Uncharacterized protein n=1 Tax=Paramecium tetraurelia TaxID=5888 RepID=A0E8F9_PARTE|nr:uncharacterized protein GSPATT00024305001 [Paramecium tetraurelia]CAK91576.1 unnamed protein product [Paramecium tetraurelia]|eukprot:XP_001458973.1 hypothetical protein (macronuclear) [Paramecium tetraurelia strain d4-2]